MSHRPRKANTESRRQRISKMRAITRRQQRSLKTTTRGGAR